MATLLRKAKSTIKSGIDIHTKLPPQPPLKEGVQYARLDTESLEVNCPNQLNLPPVAQYRDKTKTHGAWEQRLHKYSSVVQLQRRLVRKASTFNPQNRNDIASPKNFENKKKPEESSDKREATDTDCSQEQITVRSLRATRKKTGCLQKDIGGRASINNKHVEDNGSAEFVPLGSCPITNRGKAPVSVSNTSLREGLAQQQSDPTDIRNSAETHSASKGIRRKMAAPAVEPPVSYEKLKQITTDACDHALSSVTTYAHSDTESWNTQIINTILAALVQHTSSESANGASNAATQPSFKFVVNSTIIQHGASSTTEDGKSSGRRGMHSASGAYWNNEKDGMWSFKYEAAEAKGLDVVIGIIWIWVG